MKAKRRTRRRLSPRAQATVQVGIKVVDGVMMAVDTTPWWLIDVPAQLELFRPDTIIDASRALPGTGVAE
jgi:hypothetical protein